MATDPNATDVAMDPELRTRLGYGVLDVPSRSGAGFEDVRRYSYLADPALDPRSLAMWLRHTLGRPFSEKEAQATYNEIEEYRRRRQQETGEELSLEQAAHEWDDRYGYAFRRRWFLTRPEPGERRYVPGGRERGPSKVDKAAGLVLPELRPLLEAGFSVVDVLTYAAGRPLRSAKLALHRVPKKDRPKHYVRLVADLTGWTLSEEEAARVWEECLKHKAYLSERAGHDVPMERAVVDYFKRLRLSGLDRPALWEHGQLFGPDEEEPDVSGARSTEARGLFPA
jgi:hypothetical protein